MARNWIDVRRREAWAHGRALRDRLLAEYCATYHLTTPPPPAKIVDELLTEHLNVRLFYDPLPLDRFAETSMRDGVVHVTVNSDTAFIEGVKDAGGVQNVAKWHEAIHVEDHLDVIREGPQLVLEGFDEPPAIVCYRLGLPITPGASQGERAREFWAEEAGRAAAVSVEALHQTEPFRELLDRARTEPVVRSAWPLLYESAVSIGVNISALVKQLQYEGIIVLVRSGGRDDIIVQPRLREVR